MLRWFFLFLLMLPIIELMILVQVGHYLGFWATLGLVMLGAIAGLQLMKWQSAKTLQQAASGLNLAEGGGKNVLNGVFLSLAGVLLLIPGFLTDALALLLLLPFIRKPLAQWLVNKGLATSFSSMGPGMRFTSFRQSWSTTQQPTDTRVYEGEFRQENDQELSNGEQKPQSLEDHSEK